MYYTRLEYKISGEVITLSYFLQLSLEENEYYFLESFIQLKGIYKSYYGVLTSKSINCSKIEFYSKFAYVCIVVDYF